MYLLATIDLLIDFLSNVQLSSSSRSLSFRGRRAQKSLNYIVKTNAGKLL